MFEGIRKFYGDEPIAATILTVFIGVAFAASAIGLSRVLWERNNMLEVVPMPDIQWSLVQEGQTICGGPVDVASGTSGRYGGDTYISVQWPHLYKLTVHMPSGPLKASDRPDVTIQLASTEAIKLTRNNSSCYFTLGAGPESGRLYFANTP